MGAHAKSIRSVRICCFKMSFNVSCPVVTDLDVHVGTCETFGHLTFGISVFGSQEHMLQPLWVVAQLRVFAVFK